MMEWILFLWLARSPDVLMPIDSFNSKAECNYAKREETNANIRNGFSGGATYICLQNK